MKTSRSLLLAALAAALIAACGQPEGPAGATLAVEIDRSTACALDGMLRHLGPTWDYVLAPH